MILSDRVSGKVSWWGLLVAIVFALMALPGWSLGQDQPRTPAKEPPSLTPKDRPTPEPAKPVDKVPVGDDGRRTTEVPVENKREIVEIEAEIQKLENEIRRLHKLLEDRKATLSRVPIPDPKSNLENVGEFYQKAAYDDAKKRMVQAKEDFQRFTTLFKEGQITEQQLETAKRQVAEATAILKRLEAKVDFTNNAPKTPAADPAPNTTKTPYWTQEREVKFFSLRYARAVDVSRILKDLFPEDEARNPRITSDERSNSLIIRGTAKDREAIEAIVERLERAAADKIKQEETVKPPDTLKRP